MSASADERKYLHRENVKVTSHLDALADLATKRKKRPAAAPAAPAFDPRMSTTPVLQPPPQFAPAYSPPSEPLGSSAGEFFGDFETDLPGAAPQPAYTPEPSSRGEDFFASEPPGGLVSGMIDFDPDAAPAPVFDDGPTAETLLPKVSQDTPANGTPQPPQKPEAIDEVLDGFNW